jgi:hypothetical protein
MQKKEAYTLKMQETENKLDYTDHAQWHASLKWLNKSDIFFVQILA